MKFLLGLVLVGLIYRLAFCADCMREGVRLGANNCVIPNATNCCLGVKVKFMVSRGYYPCSFYDLAWQLPLWKGTCGTVICNNGIPPKIRYCGKHECNVMGCNCKGGCIEGNPLDEFIKRFGSHKIKEIYFDDKSAKKATVTTKPAR